MLFELLRQKKLWLDILHHFRSCEPAGIWVAKYERTRNTMNSTKDWENTYFLKHRAVGASQRCDYYILRKQRCLKIAPLWFQNHSKNKQKKQYNSVSSSFNNNSIHSITGERFIIWKHHQGIVNKRKTYSSQNTSKMAKVLRGLTTCWKINLNPHISYYTPRTSLNL